MRRGMSLIEILAAIPVLLAVMLVFSGLFYASLGDMPNLQRIANTNGVLSDMLWRLQQDIDAAESLPKSVFGKKANEKLLLIRGPDSTVCYEIKDGQVVREELSSGRDRQGKGTCNWSVPGAMVSFHRWQSSGGAYAVEIRRAIEYSKQGYSEEKLANSHVLYLAGVPGQREEQ